MFLGNSMLIFLPGGGNNGEFCFYFQLLLLPAVLAQQSYGGGPSGGFGGNGVGQNELWQIERPTDMAKIADLEVMCGKQHMEVQLTFDRPFNGIVFSKVS